MKDRSHHLHCTQISSLVKQYISNLRDSLLEEGIKPGERWLRILFFSAKAPIWWLKYMIPTNGICSWGSHNNYWGKQTSCFKKCNDFHGAQEESPQLAALPCRAFASLQSHRRSRHTSCLSGISIQNSWQKAVPINIFSIGSVLLLSEISHIWPLEKAEFDLVCQMLYSHEKWRSQFAQLFSPS